MRDIPRELQRVGKNLYNGQTIRQAVEHLAEGQVSGRQALEKQLRALNISDEIWLACWFASEVALKRPLRPLVDPRFIDAVEKIDRLNQEELVIIDALVNRILLEEFCKNPVAAAASDIGMRLPLVQQKLGAAVLKAGGARADVGKWRKVVLWRVLWRFMSSLIS